MAGRLLRETLSRDPDLLPNDAAGRLLLTYPRTATDPELRSVVDAYRLKRPDHYLELCRTLRRLRKYHEVNGWDVPLTTVLSKEIEQTHAQVIQFLSEECWVENGDAVREAYFEFRKLVAKEISTSEREGDDEDIVKIDVPSAEEVLSYLENYKPDVAGPYSFTITVTGIGELGSLLEMTREVMEIEKKDHWAARRELRSSDAISHAERLRIMKQLNEDVSTLRNRIWAERGWKL